MDENYVQVLIDTMTKKEETLRRILEITRRQEELSKQDIYDSDEMEKTLNEKEIQISRLNYLDDGFDSVYERIHSELRNNIEKYRQDISVLQDKIRVCTGIGNEIQVLEQRNRDRFTSLFSKVQKGYSASKSQANVAQNYHRTMNNSKIPDAYFVDKKQ